MTSSLDQAEAILALDKRKDQILETSGDFSQSTFNELSRIDGQLCSLAPTLALALIEKHRALEECMNRLTKLTESIDALIGDSEGVYGLHMNGDPAPWSELTEGGRFEEWLIELEEARAFLARQGEAG